MKKIAFLLAHFGKLNNTGYFPLFLYSCGQNPTVDFLILTDDREKYAYPENVHVIYMTFAALRERIQAHFSFPVVLEKSYQLCNFKVTYGDVFSDLFKGYDYWGHMDSDLILGDIRHFVTDQLLESYDKIYTHGHMTLYRNTEEINTLYRHSDGLNGINTDYRKVLSQGEILCFDEWGTDGGINAIFLRHNKSVYNNYDFDDIAVERVAFVPVQKRYLPPHKMMHHIVYQYRDGKLTRHGLVYGYLLTEEVLYAHFQKRRMTCSLDQLNPSRYLIVPDTFVPDQPVTEAFLLSTAKDALRKDWLSWKLRNGLKKRIRRLLHKKAKGDRHGENQPQKVDRQ